MALHSLKPTRSSSHPPHHRAVSRDITNPGYPRHTKTYLFYQALVPVNMLAHEGKLDVVLRLGKQRLYQVLIQHLLMASNNYI